LKSGPIFFQLKFAVYIFCSKYQAELFAKNRPPEMPLYFLMEYQEIIYFQHLLDGFFAFEDWRV